MNRSDFKKWTNEKVRILDGAMGTLLQDSRMPNGVCPEKWALDNPQVLINRHKEYVDAGSNIIYTFTFGANPVKLKQFGLDEQTEKLNKELALLAKKASGGKALVAGDLAPTGALMQPFGMATFEEIVDCYKRQVKGLLEGNVDLFVIETMMDLQEVRAAIIAVKESCDLPIMATMTFEKSHRTLTGTDPVTALVTLQEMGIDAFGTNCSLGPEDMVEIIKILTPYAKVPLIAKPNAGLPKVVNGKTVFEMKEKEFSKSFPLFAKAGASLIGGCCGTTPGYIREIIKKIDLEERFDFELHDRSCITSSRNTVEFSSKSVVVIGEKLDLKTDSSLVEEIQEGDVSSVLDLALEQIDLEIDVLNIDLDVPGVVDEKKIAVDIVNSLTPMIQIPFCFKATSKHCLEAALRVYPGRALVDLSFVSDERIEEFLTVASKYGAMIILKIPDEINSEDLTNRTKKFFENITCKLDKYDFFKKDIIVDINMVNMFSDLKEVMLVKQTVDFCAKKGYNTLLDLSKLSLKNAEKNLIKNIFTITDDGHGIAAVIYNSKEEEILEDIKAF